MIYFVSLKDLSSIEGRDLASGTEAEVITRLREVYDFLPKEPQISVKDGNVRIDIPEQVIANKLEATRLQEKASQRAKQGEYQKAAGSVAVFQACPAALPHRAPACLVAHRPKTASSILTGAPSAPFA